MIIGIGIDIVEVSRIKDAIQKWKGSFLDRVFTQYEVAYSISGGSIYQHLAARFAAKEAVSKAFGEGDGRKGITLTDIEIRNDRLGQPKVLLSGRMKDLQKQIGACDIAISLSHTRTYAIAGAVLFRSDNST